MSDEVVTVRWLVATMNRRARVLEDLSHHHADGDVRKDLYRIMSAEWRAFGMVLAGTNERKSHKRIEMTGMRFGTLTVGDPSHKDTHGNVYWHCKCDCGNEVRMRGDYLRSQAKSCGAGCEAVKKIPVDPLAQYRT